MLKLRPDLLAATMEAQLARRGCVAEAVHHVTASLVQTSLRGVDSHGIRLFPHYCRAVDAGRIAAEPSITTVSREGGVAVLDAGHAFGHHVGAIAIDLAHEIAGAHGLAAVAVRNSTHFGAAAYFALRPAERGAIGMAFTNADSLVKVTGSPLAFFGTNPICFTAPLVDEGPLCLDMATSVVSWNKVVQAQRSGTPIEPGWAFDAAGHETSNGAEARTLSPIGGYKGFGLGLMVEVLCGMLADGPVADELLAMFKAPIAARRQISHFFMVIDPTRFVPGQRFQRRMQDMVDRLRALPSDVGVMVPGDPEKQTHERRSAEGIPMVAEQFEEFLALDRSFERAIVP